MDIRAAERELRERAAMVEQAGLDRPVGLGPLSEEDWMAEVRALIEAKREEVSHCEQRACDEGDAFRAALSAMIGACCVHGSYALREIEWARRARRER